MARATSCRRNRPRYARPLARRRVHLRELVAVAELELDPTAPALDANARAAPELYEEVVVGALTERGAGDVDRLRPPVGMPRSSSNARVRTGSSTCQSARCTPGSAR